MKTYSYDCGAGVARRRDGNRRLTRRSFLRYGTMLGAGLTLTPLLDPLLGARAAAVEFVGKVRPHRLEACRFLLGTFVNITAVDASRDKAETAIEAAYAEILRLSAILNRHDSGTPLSHLNRFGSLNGAEPELVAVVERALAVHRLTDGVFDPSVAPLVDLLRAAGPHEPDAAAMREALDLVGAVHVRVAGRNLTLGRTGMALTLDGIGKGYVVDRASEVMARLGVRDHLINAGGDIRASGRPTPERGWRIALEDPRGHETTPSVIELRDMAVATSGAYEQTWGPGRHHIVRPDSGICPGQVLSVSVAAPTVMGADCLATALFASSPHAGLALADSLPGRECLILGQSGAALKSARWNTLECRT
ncbi:FAD:protein FMN transferase [Paucidesulfovibrio longus]|uniref:FAD:protein FMN transferase n=1 Tax=Paucidesulfovibrio longus TaxID=889 RepID=UPI0003B5F850|nr:FAD:protein FMN transferase [Paucidesulfovibrio longus]